MYLGTVGRIRVAIARAQLLRQLQCPRTLRRRRRLVGRNGNIQILLRMLAFGSQDQPRKAQGAIDGYMMTVE